jgi:hypothetical protein
MLGEQLTLLGAQRRLRSLVGLVRARDPVQRDSMHADDAFNGPCQQPQTKFNRLGRIVDLEPNLTA